MTTIQEALAALPNYTEVRFSAHGSKVLRFMARDLPQSPIRSGGRRFTCLDTGTEFFVEFNSPITDVEMVV